MPAAPPADRLRIAFSQGLILVLALALLPAVARAGDDAQRAKELFQQGTTLFNLGEFDKAIEAWQQGYKEKADPGFLYNIGQAYRLKGDATKAIFFYRGYLRNSPKAPNRAEIEAKIAALQKEQSEPKPATPGTPATPDRGPATPPPVAPPPTLLTPTPAPPAHVVPPPAGPTPIAPPPVPAPPLAGPGAPPAPEPPAPMSEPPASTNDNAPWDLSVALGLDAWTSGLNIKGSAPAQLAFSLGFGRTFGDVYGSSSFRVGALLHATSLDEGSGATANKVSFTSILVEPSLRIRLVDRRLYLTGGLGIGVLAIGGVKVTSVVLDPKSTVKNVNGTLSAFELRPAVGLQLHFSPRLLVFVSPALSFSPKPQYFYQTLGRFELMFGLAYLW
jgi:hypothetical protein